MALDQTGQNLARKKRGGRRQSVLQAACLVAVVTLVVLKLTEAINWSWWWVLSPMWGALVLNVLGIIVLLFIAMSPASKGRGLISLPRSPEA
jgi:hypothetical protein